MERELAKAIGEKSTLREVVLTLQNAERQIENWNVRSEVNRGLSKGIAFNLFVKALLSIKEQWQKESPNVDFLSLKNDWQIKDITEKVIWEFGDYYPNVNEITKNWEIRKHSHSDPIEVNWSLLTDEEPETQHIK